MSTLSKVFLVFVMLAGLGFLYTAARTEKTLDNGRRRAAKMQADLDAEVKKLKDAVDGTDAEAAKVNPTELLALFPSDGRQAQPGAASSFNGYSAAQLKTALEHVVAGRGRVWYHTKPGNADATGAVGVEIEVAGKHHIEPKMILYVLDEAEQGRYLGEFEVTEAPDGQTQIKLAPTLPLAEEGVKRLQDARGSTWSLYETMPGDRRDVLAGLPEDQLRAMLPKDAVADSGRKPIVDSFVRDGKDPLPDDPAERVFILVNFIKKDAGAQEALKSALAEQKVRPTDDELKNKYHVKSWDEFVNKEVPKMLESGQVYEIEKAVADKLIGSEIAREVGRKYRRPLQDFGVAIREFQRDKPLLEASIRNLQRDLNDVDAATKDAKVHIAFSEKIVADLKVEQETLKKELALASSRRKKIEADLKKTKAAVAKTMKSNKELAVKLVAAQEAAASQAEQAINYDQASVGL